MSDFVVTPERKEYLRRINLNAENAKKAAAALKRAFVWEESLEGYDYWAEVYEKLFYLARDGGADMSTLTHPARLMRRKKSEDQHGDINDAFLSVQK